MVWNSRGVSIAPVPLTLKTKNFSSPKVLTWLPSVEDRPSGLTVSEVLRVALSERYHCGPELRLQIRSGVRVCDKGYLIAEGLEGAAWT